MFQELQERLHMQWSTVWQIHKGWSSDTKYYVETHDHQKLVLRLSDISHYAEKEKEYQIIGKYATLGFEMSQPISFGSCNGGQNVYMLLSWVEGEDLKLALPRLGPREQYRLGRQAGEILRSIHGLPLPPEERPKETKIPKKKRQLQSYIDSKLRMAGDEAVIAYVEANIDRIWATPPVYQHGDFHPGNLILTPRHTIGVIDFNRWEIGDPYEEFYKLESFASGISVPYCIGQIDAYFEDAVPDAFWSILAVYVAHSALFSIKWAEQFDEKEIAKMQSIYQKALEHYDAFKSTVPSWYRERKIVLASINEIELP